MMNYNSTINKENYCNKITNRFSWKTSWQAVYCIIESTVLSSQSKIFYSDSSYRCFLLPLKKRVSILILRLTVTFKKQISKYIWSLSRYPCVCKNVIGNTFREECIAFYKFVVLLCRGEHSSGPTSHAVRHTVGLRTRWSKIKI